MSAHPVSGFEQQIIREVKATDNSTHSALSTKIYRSYIPCTCRCYCHAAHTPYSFDILITSVTDTCGAICEHSHINNTTFTAIEIEFLENSSLLFTNQMHIHNLSGADYCL